MRVAGSGGVVPDGSCFDPLDGHLNLSAPGDRSASWRAGPTPDDLPGGSVLGCVIRLGDPRIECGRQRPGLRPVQDHLDEPHSGCVLTYAAARLATQRVEPSDPRFVPVTVKWSNGLDSIECGNETLGQPRSLGEVIVVDAGVVGLDVVPRRGRVPAVDLHSTVHDSPPPSISNNRAKMRRGPPVAGRPIYVFRSMRAG